MIDSNTKFPNTYQIVEMLEYFKNKHQNTNTNLQAVGEGKRCKPFKGVTISDIETYIYELEGLKL